MTAHWIDQTDRATFVALLGRHLGDRTESGGSFGLLAVHLENIDQVASAYGAHAADAVIAAFAVMLRGSVRTKDRVVRIGDSRFAVICDGLADEGILTLAATKIGRLARQPMRTNAGTVGLALRIGITTSPGHGCEAEALLRNAETALLEAAAGDTPYAVFAPEQLERNTHLLRLEAELDAAIKRKDFELHFQPKISTDGFECCGAEALMRWQAPGRGFVSPEVFIPLTDRPGRMEPLTSLLLHAALVQASEWPGDLSVSINLSPRMLLAAELTGMVANALGLWGFEPRRLVVEITEGAIMADPDASFRTLSGLRDLGVQISIDDFGTGYSSFAYFKNIPADELKVDRSFVRNMLTDEGDRRIVRAIVQLSKEFGLAVTAEGVEDEATATMLASLGCDRLQGYHYARPLPQTALLAWLRDRRASQDEIAVSGAAGSV